MWHDTFLLLFFKNDIDKSSRKQAIKIFRGGRKCLTVRDCNKSICLLYKKADWKGIWMHCIKPSCREIYWKCLIQRHKTETRQIQMRNYEHSSNIGSDKSMKETTKGKGAFCNCWCLWMISLTQKTRYGSATPLIQPRACPAGWSLSICHIKVKYMI